MKQKIIKTFRYEVQDMQIGWNSTALGFGGVGGDSMTRATTTVVLKTDASADVYFGGRLAYSIHKINQLFMDDLAKRIMKPCRESGQYESQN